MSIKRLCIVLAATIALPLSPVSATTIGPNSGDPLKPGICILDVAFPSCGEPDRCFDGIMPCEPEPPVCYYTFCGPPEEECFAEPWCEDDARVNRADILGDLK